MTDLNAVQTLIIGHLWQSAAIAGVLALVFILGRRMRGSTRYGLASAAFLASLALPLAAFIPGETLAAALLEKIGPARSIEARPASPAPSFVGQGAGLESGAPLETFDLSAGALREDPNGSPATTTGRDEPVLAQGAQERAAHASGEILSGVAEPAVAFAADAEPLFGVPDITLPDWRLSQFALPLVMVWIAGSLILLARTGRDLVAVERLVARARPADLPDQLKRRMAGVRVAVSPDAPGPMAAGLFRPCIVLPESIALNAPGMAALLEHERAHIERCDMAVALLQRMTLALLWWSPALHWISRRIDEERELACDEAAVERTGDARAFARSLTLEAENQLWARAPRLAVGAIGPRSQIGRRIRRLIDLAKGASPAKYSGRLAFAGLALAIAVAAMVTPRFPASAQQAQDDKPIDLLSQQSPAAPDRPSGPARLDDRRLDGAARDFSDVDASGEDFARLGEELGAMMEALSAELELAFDDMPSGLDAELAGLSTELAGLGLELSAMVNEEVMQQMPQIMDEVRRALEAEGFDVDDWKDFAGLSEEEREELRADLAEAREEIRQAFGPELREEIRQAVAEARAEFAEQREDIRQSIEESRIGAEAARFGLAKARAAIEAARARGDFNIHIDEEIERALRERNIDVRNARAIRVRADRADTPDWRLMKAAGRCDEAEVRRLITEDSANADARFPGDGVPLMAAARRGCIDVVRALLNAGADPNLSSAGDGNPLIQAAGKGHVEVARLLVERGADVNAYVAGDETPLIAAAAEGELEMARFLVEAGADVNRAYNVESWIGRKELRSPLNMAERHGNDAVAEYLRSKGAVANPKAAN